MLIFDAHLDLAMNALEWNRDLTRTVAEIRAGEHGMTDSAIAAMAPSRCRKCGAAASACAWQRCFLGAPIRATISMVGTALKSPGLNRKVNSPGIERWKRPAK